MQRSNRLDTTMALWEHLDHATLYIPIKELKDKTNRVLVVEDPIHEGLYMLRAFLNKDDLSEYALNFKNDIIHYSRMTLDMLEMYMRRFTSPFIKSHIRLSRCMLSTVDIDRNVRDIEVIWSIRSS